MEAKYDKIGAGYDEKRKADPHLTSRLLHLLQPTKENLYLDIGCGTGNYTSALAHQGFRFVGVEPSEEMLNKARERSKEVTWIKGTAEQIPAENKTFEGVIGTLTIHHWTDLEKAFLEISRVMTDTGRMVLFTSTPEQMEGYWLNHYFPHMLQSSTNQMPSLHHMKEVLKKSKLKVAGIEKYFVRDDLQDCFLYVGKNKPEYYFDEDIRRGISSFSSLSNSGEVKAGLKNLKNDIETGAFEKIKRSYENRSGDYLFIIIEKE